MFTSDKDKLFFRKLDDAVFLCEKRGDPYFSPFLSEGDQRLAEDYLRSRGFTGYLFFGGCSNSERKMLGLSAYGDFSESDFPISAVEFRFRAADKLSHRDFLGALMSLGIERDTVGDILVEDGRCVVFLTEEISSYVTSQITKIGRAGVKLCQADLSRLPKGRGFDEQSITVSSLRLDNIVAAVSGLSREKTKSLILLGGVSLNFSECTNISRALSGGDVLSVRGKGKYKINGVTGETKKHRIKLSIIHYR